MHFLLHFLAVIFHWLMGLLHFLVPVFHWIFAHLFFFIGPILHWLWMILVFCICFVPATIPALCLAFAYLSRYIARITIRPVVILFCGRKKWDKLARRTNCRIEHWRRIYLNSAPMRAWNSLSRGKQIILIAAFCVLLLGLYGLYCWWSHCR